MIVGWWVASVAMISLQVGWTHSRALSATRETLIDCSGVSNIVVVVFVVPLLLLLLLLVVIVVVAIVSFILVMMYWHSQGNVPS